MEDNMLIPCMIWQEKLAALHPVDLSPAERATLDAHMKDCKKCTAAFADYKKMNNLLRDAFVSKSPLDLPDWLTREDFAAKLPALPVQRLYQNLPPRFDGFLGRQVELESLAEGLDSFHSLLVVEGMSGVGKTTLAIEMAYQCLQGSDLMPNSLFDAAVWVSARDRLDQKLCLNDVLSTIAHVLDYPSVAQLSFDEKRTKVTELLRTYQTLVIIDNFDAIDDPSLLDWIQQISKPSKVLVTSRDTHRFHQRWTLDGQFLGCIGTLIRQGRDFMLHPLLRVSRGLGGRSMKKTALGGEWTLHLEGLKGDEALELIRHHVQKLQLSVMESAEANELLRVTHGNPQAIAMILRDLKSRGLSLHQVLDGLRVRIYRHRKLSQ